MSIRDNYWTRHPELVRAIAWFTGTAVAVVAVFLVADRMWDSQNDVPRGLSATPVWVVVAAVLIVTPLVVLVVNASVSFARNHSPRFRRLSPEELQRRRDVGRLLRGEIDDPREPEPPRPEPRGLQRRTMVVVGVGASVLTVLAVMSYSGPSGPAYYCPIEGEPNRWCDAWIGKVTRDVSVLRDTDAYGAEVTPYAGQITDTPDEPVRLETFVGGGACVYVGRGGDRDEETSTRPWVEMGPASCPASAELIEATQ